MIDPEYAESPEGFREHIAELQAELATARAAHAELLEATRVTESLGGPLQQAYLEIDWLRAELQRERGRVPEILAYIRNGCHAWMPGLGRCGDREPMGRAQLCPSCARIETIASASPPSMRGEVVVSRDLLALADKALESCGYSPIHVLRDALRSAQAEGGA